MSCPSNLQSHASIRSQWLHLAAQAEWVRNRDGRFRCLFGPMLGCLARVETAAVALLECALVYWSAKTFGERSDIVGVDSRILGRPRNGHIPLSNLGTDVPQ
jgi:hypothetical protein